MEDQFKLYNDMVGQAFAKYVAVIITQEEARNHVMPLNKKDIQSLIDLALDTGDQEWFMELTARHKTAV